MNDEYEKYGWVDESMQEVCPDCGAFMNYHPDHDIYVCPNCDKEIKLSSEEDYEKYFPMQPYDDDNPPEGCAACGGNYPFCKDSCPMFDD